MILVVTFLLGISHGELIGLVEVARHGARAPMRQMPWDNPLLWPLGYSNLLPGGFQQHYSIGKYIQEKYIVKEKLFSSKYDPEEIEFFSTSAERSIQSLQSQILGIFPEFLIGSKEKNEFLAVDEVTYEEIKDSINNLEGVDINTSKQIESILLSKDYCEEYLNFMKSQSESPMFSEIYNDYEDVIEVSAVTLNLSIENAKVNFLRIIDWIRSCKFMDYEYPSAFDENWFEKASELYMKLRNFQRYPSDYLRRFAASAFVDELVSGFQSIIKSGTGKKVKIYSAHDTTIMNIVNTLGIPLENQPPFASVLFFELVYEENVHFVNIIHDGILLSIPELSFPIVYEDFKHYLLTRTFSNLTDACSEISNPENLIGSQQAFEENFYQGSSRTQGLDIDEVEENQKDKREAQGRVREAGENEWEGEEKDKKIQQNNSGDHEKEEEILGTAQESGGDQISKRAKTSEDEGIDLGDKGIEKPDKWKMLEKMRIGIGKNSKNIDKLSKKIERSNDENYLIIFQLIAFLSALLLVFYIIKKNSLT